MFNSAKVINDQTANLNFSVAMKIMSTLVKLKRLMCLVITSIHYLSNKLKVRLFNVLDISLEVFSEMSGLFKVNAYHDNPLYPI